MNFISAVKYMQCGYRAKRLSWNEKSHIKLGNFGELKYYLTVHENLNQDGTSINLKDFLAEDWEIITKGIRKHFTQNGSGMEYDDDIG